MKNDIMRYILKKSTLLNGIIAACIAVVVGIGVIIIAAVFSDPQNKAEAINNVTTATLAVWMFIGSVTVSSECSHISIRFNRSRKSALKAAFASLLICTLVFTVINLAAEAVVSGVCQNLGMNYTFDSLIKVGTGFSGLMLTLAFRLLVFYFVGILGTLFMTVCIKCGKWFLIVFWALYMLIILFGKTAASNAKIVVNSIFPSKDAAVLCLMVLASVIFTVIEIILARKVELTKNMVFLGFKKQ